MMEDISVSRIICMAGNIRFVLLATSILTSFSSQAYDEDLRIEKNDRYYRYFTNNPDLVGIMQREEARLTIMSLKELRETDTMLPKNNAELECIRKGDDYDVCREKYGY